VKVVVVGRNEIDSFDDGVHDHNEVKGLQMGLVMVIFLRTIDLYLALSLSLSRRHTSPCVLVSPKPELVFLRISVSSPKSLLYANYIDLCIDDLFVEAHVHYLSTKYTFCGAQIQAS